MRASAAAWPRDPARAGLVLDFDGTLAPIVEDPTTSAIAPEVGEAVTAIATRLPLVAIVSGRPAAFLAEHAALPGVRLLGVYGLEEWAGGEVVVHPGVAAAAPAVQRARDLLAAALPGLPAGVWLEDKGLSVSLHWRRAADHAAAEAAVAAIVGEVAGTTGLHHQPGKLVAELRAAAERDKGTAVTALAAGAGVSDVAYAGDDLGDLPAFAAVRALGGLCVAVDHGAETPPALLEAANVVLDGDAGTASWLLALAARLA